jgi:hypothetical protein
MPTSKEYWDAVRELLKELDAFMGTVEVAGDGIQVQMSAQKVERLLSQPEGEPSGEGLPKDLAHNLYLWLSQDVIDRTECDRCGERNDDQPCSWHKHLEGFIAELKLLEGSREGQRQATMTEVEALAEAEKRSPGDCAVSVHLPGNDWTHEVVLGYKRYFDKSFGACFAQADKERGGE